MRKYIKKQILDIIGTMYEAHISISNFFEQSEFDNALSILGDCQNTALQIGDIIDKSEGEGTPTVACLEQYCETVYQVSLIIKEDKIRGKAGSVLDESLSAAETCIKNDIPVRTEIVFMPYNASMWDSLESVWKAAADDTDCDVYVVPIPYYERNPDRSLGQYHYEGDRFPEYVPITHYSKYDLEKRRPDIIYIHNPYDGNNFITSVDPRYYSTELKKYTDELVYIPYFVLEDREQWDEAYLSAVEKYVLVPAVMNADKVIVQSENMRKIYIRTLLKYCGSSPEHLKLYTEKILGTGSPKFDKMSVQLKDSDIPADWLRLINNPNGTRKKVVFYNTTVTPIINYGEKVILKIKSVLKVFYENRDKITLLWRPHPLMKETVKSMSPKLYDEYIKIIDEYVNAGWGIYDDTPDLNRSIALCDAYYGDMSSVVQLFEQTGKKTVIQTVDTPGIIPYLETIVYPSFIEANGDLYFVQYFTNSLYVIKEDKINFVGVLPSESPAETRQHISAVSFNSHIYFLPCNSHTIVDYDICTNTFEEIELEIRHRVFPLWKYENNFRNGLIYKERLYLIPSYYDSIVYYDLETKETVHCLELTKILESIDYKDDIIFLKYEFYTERVILLPFIHSNNVLEFDLETFDYKIHAVGKGTGFISIIKYGDIYWLLERQRSIICKWCRSKGSVECIDPYPSDFKRTVDKSLFGTLCTKKIGKELFCFAGYSNMSVKIDLETNKCTHISELDKYCNGNITNILVFNSVDAVGHNIFLHYPSGQCIIKYTINTGEVSEIKISPDEIFTDDIADILNDVIIGTLILNTEDSSSIIKGIGENIYSIFKKSN